MSDRGSLARLRMLQGPHSVPIACQCRPVRAGEHRGVLAVAADGAAGSVPVEELVQFFAGDGFCAAVMRADATVVAASDGAGPGAAMDESSAAFQAAGESLRLAIWAEAGAGAETSPLGPDISPVASEADGLPEPAASPEQLPAPAAESTVATEPQAAPVPMPRAAAAKRQPRSDGGGRPAPVRPAAHLPAGPVPAPASDGAAARAVEPDVPPAEDPAPPRSVVAGRVPRELSRRPVRFLWQTDGADRFLFVSPGLSQVVGRNAEIVGERWQDAAGRLRLDPSRRIQSAIAQRDTWSGLTAWWPVEGSNVRVPAELTALPVFGPDHSFQGYRGFGVLRPAEALMPAAFEARFGAADAASMAEQLPPYEEAVATAPANVVPIRADLEVMADQARLTPQERSAFEEIAAALRDRVVGGAETDLPEPVEDAPAAPADEDTGREPILEADAPAPAAAAQDEAATEAELSADPSSDPEAAEASGPSPAEAVPFTAGDDALQSADSAESAPPGPEPEPARSAGPRAGLAEGDAQRRLREMTAILDTATDGILILDGDGRIESVNASCEALFGLEAREMQGKPLADFLAPESRRTALDYLAGLHDHGVASLLNEGREIAAQAGPGTITLFMTIGRISGNGGGRFCAVLRDITHWKRTEAELVAARRAAELASSQKSDFLARVSHEIRTPLNAIIGFAEVMIEERFGPVENERYREYLRDIRTSSEHVLSLINDLLDISKIEAGKLDLNFAAVPLNEIVRECIALMQPQASRAHVVLRSSLSRDVPSIVADHRTIRQIVLNLLSNSVKFTGPGGQVIASTSLAEGGEAILRIRDTGEGMSEEELARALEPFRQIATAPLSDRNGTGLGLPLTKALVEANRASLAIRSARGEGTVVTITFPPTRVLSE